MYFEDIKRQIEEHITDYQKQLGSGAAEDYAHYRQHVGAIAALHWCRDLVAQVQKRTAEGEDD